VIEFRHMTKTFGTRAVLDDVSFTVNDGEVFFVIGASGVGKRVLIKQPGRAACPGRRADLARRRGALRKRRAGDDPPVRQKRAMVLQHSTLFDSMTCVENVALPLRKHKGLSPKDALGEGRRYLSLVHMQEFADRYPAELGDGMRQACRHRGALSLDPALRAVRRADHLARPGERGAWTSSSVSSPKSSA
jgi:phospholipid/cholesterol/gamma-HCH transport system ATP-binding protein